MSVLPDAVVGLLASLTLQVSSISRPVKAVSPNTAWHLMESAAHDELLKYGYRPCLPTSLSLDDALANPEMWASAWFWHAIGGLKPFVNQLADWQHCFPAFQRHMREHYGTPGHGFETYNSIVKKAVEEQDGALGSLELDLHRCAGEGTAL